MAEAFKVDYTQMMAAFSERNPAFAAAAKESEEAAVAQRLLAAAEARYEEAAAGEDAVAMEEALEEVDLAREVARREQREVSPRCWPCP